MDADLAGRILMADKHILRVIVIGAEGQFLASKNSTLFHGTEAVGDELQRRSMAFSVAFGAAEGVMRYMGNPQYLVFAFDSYKVLVMRAPFKGGLINVRLPRDVNGEDVFNSIVDVLKK